MFNNPSLPVKTTFQSHTQWRARARGGAIVGVLLVPLVLSGCGSNANTAPTTNPGDTDDPAARAKALEANPGVPPQVKEQMSRGSQSQQPAGAPGKP